MTAAHDVPADQVTKPIPCAWTRPTAQRLANEVTVIEPPVTELDDVPAGQVLCQYDAGGWSFYAWRRSDLTPEQAARFDQWARQRAYILFLTRDLAVDGWSKRTSDEVADHLSSRRGTA